MTDIHSLESSGTIHKELTFSEYCGTSYQGISDKFVEYLKLCYCTWSHSNTSMFAYPFCALAKEKRCFYTLGPVLETEVVPPEPSSMPAVSSASTSNSLRLPVSQPPRSQLSTGPDQTQKLLKQARMRTGPLPPHLKEHVLMNMALARTS